MIGAVILKLALRGTMNDLNNRRKEKIIANYADDAVIIYRGKSSMSGTRKGKAGMVFENTCITALKIRGGKVVELQDFYFDVDTLQKMWGEWPPCRPTGDARKEMQQDAAGAFGGVPQFTILPP
jgi:hypothetical protein